MKFAFPTGSTSLLLLFLALVALIKGCSNQRAALTHLTFKDPADIEATTRQITAYSEGIRQGNLWFSAAVLLLLLGFGCLWIGKVMHRRARLMQASKDLLKTGSNLQPIRRKRRR
jgi:hypothetical protein